MSSSDDMWLCNTAWKRIVERYPEEMIATELAEQERIVVLVWTVTGIIDNGGFRFLFESKMPSDPTLEFSKNALKRIGCLEAAEALEQALSLFDNGVPPLDDHIRIGEYERQSEEVRQAIDSRFWITRDDIVRCLASYIRANKILSA